MHLLISGYGSKDQASGRNDTAGIFDTCNEKFIFKSGISGISFMCSSDKYFFGAGEHGGSGLVYMFSKDGSDSLLLDTLEITGGGLCHIAYSCKHNILTGACYENGDVFSVAINDDKFGEICSYIPQRDEKEEVSRAHCVVFSPDENYLYVANIAFDRIYEYEIENGRLKETRYAQLDKGVGPRHLLHTGKEIYVITEYSNEIITLCPDDLKVINRIDTLPDGYTEKSYCSTLCLSSAGYLYAANRGSNTIAVFKRNDNGDLTKKHDCSCLGDWPRHIALIGGTDDTGKDCDDPKLLITNQNSNQMVICSLNPNGSLGEKVFDLSFDGVSYTDHF